MMGVLLGCVFSSGCFTPIGYSLLSSHGFYRGSTEPQAKNTIRGGASSGHLPMINEPDHYDAKSDSGRSKYNRSITEYFLIH